MVSNVEPSLALAALTRLLRGWVYLAELHLLVVGLAANFGNERALVANVLGLRALPVATVAYFTHDAQGLRPAREATNKRGRTFVLSASYFYSCVCRHSGKTLAHRSLCCPCLFQKYNVSMFVMNNLTQERRQTLVFRLAFVSAILILLVVLITAGFELYVRWFVNKDFMLLGGFELEALTLSASALILGMTYLYRPTDKKF